jgi:class 3 adenylate cyclase
MAALEIVNVMKPFEEHGISFRIGLHCGPVIGGVVGSSRTAWDVWGDAVNVASRMESTGEAGRVHVSEQFASFLASARNDSSSPVNSEGGPVILSVSEEPFPIPYSLFPRGEVEVKGKGRMTTFWLESR